MFKTFFSILATKKDIPVPPLVKPRILKVFHPYKNDKCNADQSIYCSALGSVMEDPDGDIKIKVSLDYNVGKHLTLVMSGCKDKTKQVQINYCPYCGECINQLSKYHDFESSDESFVDAKINKVFDDIEGFYLPYVLAIINDYKKSEIKTTKIKNTLQNSMNAGVKILFLGESMVDYQELATSEGKRYLYITENDDIDKHLSGDNIFDNFDFIEISLNLDFSARSLIKTKIQNTLETVDQKTLIIADQNYFYDMGEMDGIARGIVKGELYAQAIFFVSSLIDKGQPRQEVGYVLYESSHIIEVQHYV